MTATPWPSPVSPSGGTGTGDRGEPGMLTDLGYLGTATIIGTRKPAAGISPRFNAPATAHEPATGGRGTQHRAPGSTGRSWTPAGVEA